MIFIKLDFSDEMSDEPLIIIIITRCTRHFKRESVNNKTKNDIITLNFVKYLIYKLIIIKYRKIINNVFFSVL